MHESWIGGGTYDDLSLGTALRAGDRQALSASFESVRDSWRVDETYVKVKGRWKYLYRAIDKKGSTLDFLLTAKRDATAAKRFWRRRWGAVHTSSPRVINVDKNKAYPPAVEELKTKVPCLRRAHCDNPNISTT